MSWLARSLVNSFRGDDNQESEDNPSTKPGSVVKSGAQTQTFDETSSPSRGVKEDLSELTKTITRQFWGVASFLAPPPDISPYDPSDSTLSEVSDESEVSKSPRMAGIRSDFAELGGKFKSGISMLSNAKAVSEISKIASTFLPFGDDGAEEEEENRESGGEALGVTEDVLLFVKNISVHPETWLDFPLISGDEDPAEFEMSDAQQEHALAVEHLEPSLAALRIELCPSHMSEGSFWKIYFVLLHSRLNKNDAELLSTPQIVQARAALLQDLESRRKPNADECSWKNKKEEEQPPPEIPSAAPTQAEDASAPIPVLAVETKKHPVESSDVKIIDKSVIEEDRSQKGANRPKDDENFEDDWLEDEAGEAKAPAPLGNDEDVSFSDLEEDDDDRSGTKWIPKPNPAEGKESKGWVQLSKNRASPAPKSRDGWSDVDELDIE